MQSEYNGIEKRLDELSERLARLKPLKSKARLEFDKDAYLRDIAERNLEIAIQCCIDICHRIISLENTRKPADYYEAFLLVGELGIISPAYRHLQQLSDLEQFADKIRHWLQRKNS